MRWRAGFEICLCTAGQQWRKPSPKGGAASAQRAEGDDEGVLQAQAVCASPRVRWWESADRQRA
jgi:hypothetical protein